MKWGSTKSFLVSGSGFFAFMYLTAATTTIDRIEKINGRSWTTVDRREPTSAMLEVTRSPMRGFMATCCAERKRWSYNERLKIDDAQMGERFCNLSRIQTEKVETPPKLPTRTAPIEEPK